MSIKIDGGDGAIENVIKAGASNELLYNDKEVLLKENLGSGLLPPDLARTQVQILSKFDIGASAHSFFIVPEDGWIVKVGAFDSVGSSKILKCDYFVSIDGITEAGITPGQYFIGEFSNSGSTVGIPVGICNVNCPYPVKKGQTISHPPLSSIHLIGTVSITFAPNKIV